MVNGKKTNSLNRRHDGKTYNNNNNYLSVDVVCMHVAVFVHMFFFKTYALG